MATWIKVDEWFINVDQVRACFDFIRKNEGPKEERRFRVVFRVPEVFEDPTKNPEYPAGVIDFTDPNTKEILRNYFRSIAKDLLPATTVEDDIFLSGES